MECPTKAPTIRRFPWRADPSGRRSSSWRSPQRHPTKARRRMSRARRILRDTLFLSGFFILLILPACGGASTHSQTAPTPSATITAASDLFPPRYNTQLRGDVAYGSARLETLDLCQPVGAPTP